MNTLTDHWISLPDVRRLLDLQPSFATAYLSRKYTGKKQTKGGQRWYERPVIEALREDRQIPEAPWETVMEVAKRYRVTNKAILERIDKLGLPYRKVRDVFYVRPADWELVQKEPWAFLAEEDLPLHTLVAKRVATGKWTTVHHLAEQTGVSRQLLWHRVNRLGLQGVPVNDSPMAPQLFPMADIEQHWGTIAAPSRPRAA